jgi:Uma2 family endonuclease
MLVDIASDLTKVIIEITHTQGLKRDLKKMLELMEQYEVQEGFVYDYKQRIWYRCDLTTKKPEAQNAYCSAINTNLNDFLK